MMVIDNKYDIEQVVYLRMDAQQQQRIVTQISVRKGSLLYELNTGGGSSWHYEFEITNEKDVVKATTGE
jgi:hypothetical protein